MSEKKSKNKKVLVASMILAAMIVASSSFAWFTSHDEVVNKLSAKNEYAVTVTENFTPPEQWIPGQTISKEAGAVNTGNIDAFVKLTLSNSLVLTKYGTPEAFNGENVANYVELDDKEVKSLQAGGWLVWNAGTLVTNKRQGTGFTPTATGLYVFERDNGTLVTDTKVEYAGYYYDSTNSKYYALAEITPTKDTNTQAITDFTAKLQTKKTGTVTPTLAYDSTNNKVVATYNPKQVGGEGYTTDETITINIKLDNNAATNWTNNTGTTEFYYKHILVAGEESAKLVKELELDKSVKNKAYIAMDYNLKITADSVQVTEGTNKATAVNGEWVGSTATVTGIDVDWTF